MQTVSTFNRNLVIFLVSLALINISVGFYKRFNKSKSSSSTQRNYKVKTMNLQKNETYKKISINYPLDLFERITGFKVSTKEIIKILDDLGFIIKKKNNHLNLITPSWRPDILQPIDIVEEIVRIKGYDQIKTELPEKVRKIPTLNKQQKLFHFLQRSIASKGY